MNFDNNKMSEDEYPVEYYEEFIRYIKYIHEQHCWNVLPKDMAHWWVNRIGIIL